PRIHAGAGGDLHGVARPRNEVERLALRAAGADAPTRRVPGVAARRDVVRVAGAELGDRLVELAGADLGGGTRTAADGLHGSADEVAGRLGRRGGARHRGRGGDLVGASRHAELAQLADLVALLAELVQEEDRPTVATRAVHPVAEEVVGMRLGAGG